MPGADTENIFLARKIFYQALPWLLTWLLARTPEDMCRSCRRYVEEVIKKYLSADIVIFATPLYIDNVSGIMKNFADCNHSDGDRPKSHGEVRHRSGEKKEQEFVMMANSGFPEQTHFQDIRLLAQRLAGNFDTETSGGDLQGRKVPAQEEELKPWIDAYKMRNQQDG